MSQYKTEKAVFVGVVLEKGGERKVQEYLDELQFLAETAGALGDKMFMQRMDRRRDGRRDAPVPDAQPLQGPRDVESACAMRQTRVFSEVARSLVKLL